MLLGHVKAYDFTPDKKEPRKEKEPSSNVSKRKSTRQCICSLCPDGSEGGQCCKYRRWTAISEEKSCFTLTTEFLNTALNKECLRLFILRLEQDFIGDITPSQYRYQAYEVVFNWFYPKRVGKGCRIPLPPCTVAAIRQHFPSPDNEYTGFCESFLQRSGLVRGPGQLLREFNAENDEDDSEEDFDDESVHEEENIVYANMVLPCFLSKRKDVPWLWKRCGTTKAAISKEGGHVLFRPPKGFEESSWRAALLFPGDYPWPPNARFCGDHFASSAWTMTSGQRNRLNPGATLKDVLEDSDISSANEQQLLQILDGLLDCPERETYFPMSADRCALIFDGLQRVVSEQQVVKFRAAIEELMEKFSSPVRRVAEQRLQTWLASSASTSQGPSPSTPRTQKRKWMLSRKCGRLVEEIAELASEEQLENLHRHLVKFMSELSEGGPAMVTAEEMTSFPSDDSSVPDLPTTPRTPPLLSMSAPRTPKVYRKTPTTSPISISELDLSRTSSTESSVDAVGWAGGKRKLSLDESFSADEADDDGTSSSTSGESGPASRQVDYFFVSRSQLHELLQRCTLCGAALTDVSVNRRGSLCERSGTCTQHGERRWRSSSLVSALAAVNLDLAVAACTSGVNVASIMRMSRCMGLAFPSRSTLERLQQSLVYEAVDNVYAEQQNGLIEELKSREDGIDTLGDGRFSQPGFSAFIGMYTLMDDKTKAVIHCEAIQCSETTSSPAMEQETAKRCLEWWNSTFDRGPRSLCTDRHRGIQKLIKTTYPEIQHTFDLWHYQKSLTKQISGLGVRQGRREIQPWSRHLANHFLWCVENCGGQHQKLVELWLTSIFHTCNRHEQCAHGPLSDEEIRTKAWLEEGGTAHQTLSRVIRDFAKNPDLTQTLHVRYSSHLESFHSVVNVYSSKPRGYNKQHFLVNSKCAILDWNSNLDRAVVGTTMAWSRPRQEWVLRPVKAAKNEEWRQDVRGRSHDLALERTKPTKTLAKEARLQGLPSRGHRVERPLRTELFRQNLAREERRRQAAEHRE